MQKLKEKEEKKKEGKRKAPAEAPKDSEERGSKRKKEEVGGREGGEEEVAINLHPQPLLSACFWSCDRMLVWSPSSQGEKARGFGRGLQPERIIGATDSSGELMFLMKWWVLAASVLFLFFYS